MGLLIVLALSAISLADRESPSGQLGSGAAQSGSQAPPASLGAQSASLAPAGVPSTALPAGAKRRVTDAYAKLPLAFIPNAGQTDGSVRYYAQGRATASASQTTRRCWPSKRAGTARRSTCASWGRTPTPPPPMPDPNTGASIYDTTKYQGQSGWFKVGGTSLSAPLIAGVYALAGNASAAAYPALIPYANRAGLHDVTSGSNGNCGTIMCSATSGYDGPIGVGTPNGTSAF